MWADNISGSKVSFHQVPGQRKAIFKDSKGKVLYKHEPGNERPAHRIEQDVFFEKIRKGEPINQAKSGAISTMTAILGRMAEGQTYSGQMVTWEEAMNSDLSLMPERFEWDAMPPVVPDENGEYPVPVPGLTKVM